MFKTIFMAIICFLLLSAGSYAADTPKIGTIDFQEIMRISVAGKSFQEKIKQKGEELKSKLDQAQMDIKRLEIKYQNESPLLSDDEKKNKIMEIQLKVNDLRKLQQQSAKGFNDLRAELINEIKKNVKDYAKKLGEKKGYLLVIEKETGTVFYARNPIDITDKIILDYNNSINEKK